MNLLKNLLLMHNIFPPVAECQNGEENKDATNPHNKDNHHHDGVAVALFYYNKQLTFNPCKFSFNYIIIA